MIYKTDYSKYTDQSNARALRSENESPVVYVAKLHSDHKEKVEINTFSGEKVELLTTQKFNNNYREALPQLATIIEGEGEFKAGDKVLTYHFAFVNQDRVAFPFKTVDEEDVYQLDELQILCKINEDGSFEPRSQVVICEPLKEELFETTLELSDHNIDFRRDLVKVLKTWKGCELDIDEEKDYLILDEGGDYLFKHNKKDYVAVDLYWDSAIAIVNNRGWRDKEVKRHMKDHNDLGYGD